MTCREIRPKVGDAVTLRQPPTSHNLPVGIADGSTAKVLAFDHGTLTIEQDGKEWEVSDRCIEHEMEYQIGNRWLPKNHPDVIKARGNR